MQHRTPPRGRALGSVRAGWLGIGALALVASLGLAAQASRSILARQGADGEGAERRDPMAGSVAVEERPHAPPALRAELPFRSASSELGWGSVRLLGHPREDELAVRAVLATAATTRRWREGCRVELRAGERAIAHAASYVGVTRRSGAYDAVRVELTIEELRAMAHAPVVQGTVCGDPFALGDAQRATLRAFVDEFDELATERAPSRETELPLAPPDPDAPEEEDPNTWLEPA